MMMMLYPTKPIVSDLYYQHDQSLPEKHAALNLLHAFCRLIDSVGVLASKRPFSIIVQMSIFSSSLHCIVYFYHKTKDLNIILLRHIIGRYRDDWFMIFFVISLLYCYKDLNDLRYMLSEFHLCRIKNMKLYIFCSFRPLNKIVFFPT